MVALNDEVYQKLAEAKVKILNEIDTEFEEDDALNTLLVRTMVQLELIYVLNNVTDAPKTTGFISYKEK